MFYVKKLCRMDILLVTLYILVSNINCQDASSGIKGLLSYNYPQLSIGEKGENGELFLLSGEIQKFEIVAALNGQPGAVSFQSVRKLGYYLHHVDGLGFLHRDNGLISFKNNASFIVRNNKFYKGYSAFESWNYHGAFLRHQGYRIKLQLEGNSQLYKMDASFLIADDLSSTFDIDLPLTPQARILNGSYIAQGETVTFKLKNITGPVDTDISSSFMPDKCTSQEFVKSPGKRFCMNENNGDIYNTLFTTNSRAIKHGNKYTFYVEVSPAPLDNHTRLSKITVMFKDKCNPARDFYPDPNIDPFTFETCVGPYYFGASVFDLLNSTNTSLTLPRSAGVVLGFQFPTRSFGNADVVSFEFEVWADGIKHKFNKSITAELKQIVDTPNINNLLNKKVFLSLIVQFRNGTRIYPRISQFEVYFTSQWQPCSESRCVTLFKNWKESIQKFSSQSECRYDPYFFDRYFSICTELKPKFTTPPRATNTNIGGCVYQSIVDLNGFSYLLLNGTKRINFTSTSTSPIPARRKRALPNVRVFRLPMNVIQSLDDEGYYQCVIFDPSRMSAPVLSNRSSLLILPEPVFIEAGGNISAHKPVGSEQQITGCSFQSLFPIPITHIYILKNGLKRISLPQIPKEVDGGTYDFPSLSLSPIKITDKGYYQCAINYKGKEILSNIRFSITVEELNVTFVSSPVKKSNYLECSFTVSRPGLILSGYWLLNDTKRINATATTHFRRLTQFFLRQPISRFDDIGYYQCVVYAPDYMTSPVFSNKTELITLSGPKFKSILLNISVTIGSPFAILKCEFDSEITFHTNETYWLKDGTEIQAVVGRLVRVPDTMNSYIFPLKSLNESFQDEGFYQCGIFAPGFMLHPVLSDKIYLTINGIKTTFLPNAAQISDTIPKNVSCRFTTNLGKFINYSGYWLHNKTIQIPTTIHRRGALYEFENLTLDSYSNSGMYQCVVFNKKFMKIAAKSNFSRVVKFRDPIFTDTSSDGQIHNVSMNFNFTLPPCVFRSEVKINSNGTVWLKDGKRIIVLSPKIVQLNASYYKFPSNGFVLTNNLSQGGSYQCQIHVSPYMQRPVLSRRYRIRIEDLAINFTSHPKYGLNPESGLLTITGCVATVPVNTPKFLTMKGYWMRSNKKTDHPIISLIPNEKKQYIFPDLPVEYYNETIGVYHCVIYNDDVIRTHISSGPSQDSLLKRSFPNITKGPVISTQNITPASPFKIIGCKINYPLRLSQGDVYWLFNGERINSSGISLVNNIIDGNMKMHDLSFTKALLKHQGKYQCAVFVKSLMKRPIISQPIEVSINVPVIFTQSPTVNLSKDSLTITGCKYNANQDLLEVSYWLFNGDTILSMAKKPSVIVRPIPEQIRRSTNEPLDYEFLLPEILITDVRQIGTYQCVINSTSLGLLVVSTAVNVTEIPAPKFTMNPTLTVTSEKVGGRVEISNCRFTSAIRLKQEHVYWLKDGQQKIPTQSTRVFGEFSKDGGGDGEFTGRKGPIITDSNEFTTKKLIISQSNFTTQGYYRCVINVPGLLRSDVKSKKVDVQFNDISDTRVVVKIDSPFSDTLFDSSSIEYQNLKRKVENELQKLLNSKDNEEIRRKRIIEVLGFSKGSTIATTIVRYVNATDSERLDNCHSIKNALTSKDQFSDLNIQSIKVNNLDCCEKSVVGEESFKGEFFFNNTLVSRNATNQCQYNSDGKTTRRQCISDLEIGPQWLDVDLKECLPKTKTTFNLIVLNETVICSQNTTKNCSSPIAMAERLRTILHNSSVITTKEDISMAESIISNTVNNLFVNVSSPRNISKQENKAIADILDCVSIVLDSPITLVAKAQLFSDSSTGILNSLDKLAKKIGMTGVQNYTNSKRNIGLFVTNLVKTDFQVDAFESNSNVFVTIQNKTQAVNRKDILSRITVPEDAFKKENEIVYSYIFRNDDLFLNAKRIEMLVRQSNAPARRMVQSSVSSVTVGDSVVTSLDRPVSLLFRKFTHVDLQGNNTCEFWNFSLGVYGRWSKSGCYRTLEKEVDNFVACECTHLTNFALLLDVSQSGNNPLELQIVTWIGCAISLAGLSLTILTFLIFSNLRKKLPPKILICLSISLMALLIIFLAGIEETSSRDGCKAIAALLQYFMLTTFCWMAVEGVNLYKCFVKVFKTGGDKKFIIRASIFAWGLPVVIVAITAGIEPDNLGNNNFCVVHGNSFYFGILLPITIILLTNFIILFLVMRGLSKGSMRKINSDAQKLFSQARIAFMCSMLLGITWALALFAVGEATTAFQWLFCIFNSLQGFFIFVFYTLRNNEARTEWKKFLGFHISKSNSSNTYEMSKGKQIGRSHVMDSAGYDSDSSSKNMNLKVP